MFNTKLDRFTNVNTILYSLKWSLLETS